MGCIGCRMAAEGRPAQSHSEACRKRLDKLLREEGNTRVERADEREKKREEGSAPEINQDFGG